MPNRRKVLITGAAGYIAGRMLPEFRQRYELVLLDVKTTNRQGEEVEGVQIAELTDPDRDAYRHHFEGVDAVVHCAFKGGSFENELANIQMAYNLYQTCIETDVRRVVVCSSNHAADYYERLIWADKWDVVTPEMRPSPITFTDGRKRRMNTSALSLRLDTLTVRSYRMCSYASVDRARQIWKILQRTI